MTAAIKYDMQAENLASTRRRKWEIEQRRARIFLSVAQMVLITFSAAVLLYISSQ